MIKRPLRFLLLTLVLPLSACAEPTLRDGLWELSFQDVKRRDRQHPEVDGMDFPQPKCLTEIQLGSSSDGTEMAEIRYVAVEGAPSEGDRAPGEQPEAPEAQQAPRSMFGDIRRAVEGNPPTIHIEDQDKTWAQWRMWGVIVAPEEIKGTHFSALQRGEAGAGLDGRWHLRWLGEK